MKKRSSWIILTLIFLAFCTVARAAEPADVIYHNARIYTVNANEPWVEAVAIKNGRFLYVGSNDGLKPYAGPETKIVDLGGRMSMPGLHDAHQHLLKAQLRNIYCNVPTSSNVEQIVVALKECAKGRAKDEWIVADAYRGDLFPGGQAHRKYIDAAFPDTPVYMREWSYHHALANSRALELAGVDRNTPDPVSGRILKDEAGEPTGELLSKATWLVSQKIPPLPEQVVREAVLRSARQGNQFGITSAQEATATPDMLREIKRLDESGEWPIRLAAHIVWGNSASSMVSMEDMEEAVVNRSFYRSAHLFTDYVKIYIDGSPLQPHATDVQLDEHGKVPVERLYESLDTLYGALARFDKMGIKVKMHAVGTGATQVALDAIEAARIANGHSSGVVHDISHSLRYTPEDIGRLAKVGAVAEMSPAIWQIKGPLTQNLKDAWQFKSLHDAGALITLGSDWVVLPEPNLFPAIGGMVDHGDESVTLADAIQIATLNGAKSVGWGAFSGSIEQGKFADMIVLDRNIFEIPVAEIAKTRVLKTIFEGKEVYSAE